MATNARFSSAAVQRSNIIKYYGEIDYGEK